MDVDLLWYRYRNHLRGDRRVDVLVASRPIARDLLKQESAFARRLNIIFKRLAGPNRPGQQIELPERT